MPNNKEQQEAIDFTPYRDLLIAAGAGSGKTATLKQKVSNVLLKEIDGKKILPSEILVLTFTNNAAHEMKERIIGEFKDPSMKEQVASAHIQTFDSFSSYLVKKYSARLGISDNFNVLTKDVNLVQLSKLTDVVLDRYLTDPLTHDQFVKTATKLNLVGYDSLTRIVIDLYNSLNKLTFKHRAEFVNKYDETFLSKEKFDASIELIVNAVKEQLTKMLYLNAYLSKFRFELSDHKDDLLHTFEDVSFFQTDVSELTCGVNKYTAGVFKKVQELLTFNGQEFIKKFNSFFVDNKNLELKRITDNKIGESIDKDIYTSFRDYLTKDNPLINLSLDFDKEYARIVSFKDDIHLLLEMVNDLENELYLWKVKSNAFTFADISNMALKLVTDDEYLDIQKEIRNSFKFIMVDEYQDTNDFQEEFINALLKEKEDGTRSHLFCVGDAKQAIYAFRNSNVELFRQRQNLYLDDSDAKVIFMNKNYRSAEMILHDINYIFKHYMSLAHGQIDFSVPGEQLVYPKDANMYDLPCDDFGIKRITSVSGVNGDNYPGSMKEWEAKAIINDIKNKVDNKYQVYDNHHFRDVTYKDFCIIVRTKSGQKLYQKLFNEANIPLNNSTNTVLQEVDSIIVIESLIKLIICLMNNDKTNIRLNFASIARSYLYQMDDSSLFKILYDSKKDLNVIYEQPIIKDVEEFIKKTHNYSLDRLFIAMINDFKIVKKLYLIGNIEDHIQKIDSLYQNISSFSTNGEGLNEFSNLLKSVSKYKLSFESETVIELDNAVSMMTIHASKGLEKRIVYLPCSFNKLSRGQGSRADYTFSKDFGVILPDYEYDSFDLSQEEYKKPAFNVYNIANVLSNDDTERNEHVRLFYVALTRAQNTIYIVGDQLNDDENESNNETLYGMLSYCPHYDIFNEKLIDRLLDRGDIDEDLYDAYKELASYSHYSHAPIDEKTIGTNYKYYNYIFDNVVKNHYEEAIEIIKDSIIDAVKTSYFEKLEKAIDTNNKDVLASFLGFYKYNLRCHTYDNLVKELNERYEKSSKDEDDFGKYDYVSIDDLNREFSKLKDVLNEPEKETKTSKKDLEKKMLAAIYAFDNELYLTKKSYKTDEYSDDCITFDYLKYNGKSSNNETTLLNLEQSDVKIAFDERQFKKASKPLVIDDEKLHVVLDRGTHLHHLLELTDLHTKDTSFIKDIKDREIIDKLLSNNIFNFNDSDQIYKEFSYFDTLYNTAGFIDLLVVRNGIYYIIDYKSSNIDDDAYKEQLAVYERNVMRLFNVEQSKIKKYLVSILKVEVKEIK